MQDEGTKEFVVPYTSEYACLRSNDTDHLKNFFVSRWKIKCIYHLDDQQEMKTHVTVFTMSLDDILPLSLRRYTTLNMYDYQLTLLKMCWCYRQGTRLNTLVHMVLDDWKRKLVLPTRKSKYLRYPLFSNTYGMLNIYLSVMGGRRANRYSWTNENNIKTYKISNRPPKWALMTYFNGLYNSIDMMT